MPFDGSACSQRALVEAARLARLCSGTLRVLHIVDPVKHVTGFERPEVYTDEIHPAANLIVLGTHGRRGPRDWPGPRGQSR